MQVVLPTAPRAALGPGVDDERIPHRPPFTAYIANLPYDVDEGEIMETFEKARLKVYFVYLKSLLAADSSSSSPNVVCLFVCCLSFIKLKNAT